MEDERAHIGLVLTGGTIASTKVGEMVLIDLTDTSFAEAALVEQAWTGHGKLQVHVRVPLRKLSEDMHPNDWIRIADAVRDLVDVGGLSEVLVFHGTDTAGYTAAALSFLLADLDATVVVTGSNVPGNESGSDAPTNVRDAIVAARSLRPGVYLSFAGAPGLPSEVHLGCAVRKVKAEGQAYASPNYGPIALVTEGTCEVLREWGERDPIGVRPAVDPDVVTLAVHPGIDLEMLSDAVIGTGKRGVVVRLYPCGTSPESYGRQSLPAFVRRCTAAGIVVVACVEQYAGSDAVYPSLEAVRRAGAIFAGAMIPEVAFVKLSWSLAQADRADEVAPVFLRPVAGELLPGDLFGAPLSAN